MYKLSVHTVISNVTFVLQVQFTPIDSAEQVDSYDCEIPQGRVARFVIHSNSNHKMYYIFTREKLCFPSNFCIL